MSSIPRLRRSDSLLMASLIFLAAGAILAGFVFVSLWWNYAHGGDREWPVTLTTALVLWAAIGSLVAGVGLLLVKILWILARTLFTGRSSAETPAATGAEHEVANDPEHSGTNGT